MAKIEVVNSHVDEVIDALHRQKAKVLEEWGLIGEAYASDYCPVDTGRLRASITHDRDDDTMYLGTNVEYAPYVEMGTERMQAQPFLRPAIENHLSEYQSIAQEELSM